MSMPRLTGGTKGGGGNYFGQILLGRQMINKTPQRLHKHNKRTVKHIVLFTKNKHDQVWTVNRQVEC